MVPEGYRVNKVIDTAASPTPAKHIQKFNYTYAETLRFACKNNGSMQSGSQHAPVDHRPAKKVHATRFLESSPSEGGKILNFSPSRVDGPLEGGKLWNFSPSHVDARVTDPMDSIDSIDSMGAIDIIFSTVSIDSIDSIDNRL